MNQGSSTNRTPSRRPARRRRAATRRMRQFEGVLAQLPVVQMDWRGALQGVQAPAVLLPTPWAWSKLLSGVLLAVAISVLTLIHWEDEWYLYSDQIAVGRLTHLTATELIRAADVEGWNIFWIEPEQVRHRLLAHRWVQDAHVEVGLPTRLHIDVVEQVPVAVWLTSAGGYWVAAGGVTYPMTAEEMAQPFTVPQIVDSLGEARARFVESDYPMLDSQILESALALIQALPELEGNIRYNRGIGLNFPLVDPAIWVYWGDGLEMDHKLENLAASRTLLRQDNLSAQILDVRFAGRPYLR